MSRTRLSRRECLRLATAAGVGFGSSGWLPTIAAATESARREGKHCVLLWMAGGPSQLDTFDLKPAHPNGGPIQPIATSVPGISISEHLPQLAKHADSLAILRGMSTKEGDHGRGTVLMRTGHVPGGPVNYPAIGCSLSKSLGHDVDVGLPDYISIAPGAFSQNSIRPGFLGPKYAAMKVDAMGPPSEQDFAQLRVSFLERPRQLHEARQLARLELWRAMQAEFLSTHATENVQAQHLAYQSAIRMLESDARDAFDLDDESDQVRQAYGRTAFGQGCLMARRLIERGVPLVEVTLGQGLSWDTHADNFTQVKRLSEQLDAGWATLMSELSDRGLLERTTFLWAGEFGRTPTINPNGGRDHYPQAFSCVLAGGGVAGGQVYGATSEDGAEVTEGKMNQQDLLATLCGALGVDPSTENIAEGGRPIAIAEGRVVTEVLA